MKNFLIPTTFQNDTKDAVKTAVNYADGTICNVILMLVTEIPETYSASTLLRNLNNKWTNAQENVLETCREIVAQYPNCNLKFHTQHGISSPVIKNLLDFFNVDLIIIPTSFKNSGPKINALCCQIFSNYKRPILHITDSLEEGNFTNAIYLENEKSNYPLATIQQLVNDQFSLKIISQARILSSENNGHIFPLVSEAIKKNHVNIIIETRKPHKIKLKAKHQLSDEALGLPILSIYEESYS